MHVLLQYQPASQSANEVFFKHCVYLLAAAIRLQWYRPTQTSATATINQHTLETAEPWPWPLAPLNSWTRLANGKPAQQYSANNASKLCLSHALLQWNWTSYFTHTGPHLNITNQKYDATIWIVALVTHTQDRPPTVATATRKLVSTNSTQFVILCATVQNCICHVSNAHDSVHWHSINVILHSAACHQNIDFHYPERHQ